MPKYFFHLHTANSVEPDSVGVEFPSLGEAVADAQRALHEYLRDEGIDDPREDVAAASRLRTRREKS